MKEKIELYIDILKKWNKKINLVGRSSLDDAYNRHIMDGYNVAEHIPDKSTKIIDLGSGSGIPGIVMSIIGYQNIRLIECNAKKIAFLQYVINALNLDTILVSNRIESGIHESEVLTCRAFASIDKILTICSKYIYIRDKIVLLKGRSVEQDILDAQKKWLFRYQIHHKINGCVIEIYPDFIMKTSKIENK